MALQGLPINKETDGSTTAKTDIIWGILSASYFKICPLRRVIVSFISTISVLMVFSKYHSFYI
jgi:hypothetical protein